MPFILAQITTDFSTSTSASYVGTRSGHLRLLGKPVPTWRHAFAMCRCNAVVEVRLADFLRGHVKSCGGDRCRLKEDLTGRTFGRLTVTGLAARGRARQWRWNTQCSCGNAVKVWGKALVTGNTRSCGCLRRERSTKKAAAQARLHGGRFTCQPASS